MGKRNQKKTQKENNNLVYIIIGAVLLTLGIIIFLIAKPTGKAIKGEGEFDDFAKCLTENGAIFYGTEWCGFCQRQKESFGASMQYINFVDCDQNRNTCMSEGITGYPTWKINGQLYSGLQQLDRLSSLSGCELFA